MVRAYTHPNPGEHLRLQRANNRLDTVVSSRRTAHLDPQSGPRQVEFIMRNNQILRVQFAEPENGRNSLPGKIHERLRLDQENAPVTHLAASDQVLALQFQPDIETLGKRIDHPKANIVGGCLEASTRVPQPCDAEK